MRDKLVLLEVILTRLVYSTCRARSQKTFDARGMIVDPSIASHVFVIVAHFCAVNRLYFIDCLKFVNLVHGFLELSLCNTLLPKDDVKCELPDVLILHIGQVKTLLPPLTLRIQ